MSEVMTFANEQYGLEWIARFEADLTKLLKQRGMQRGVTQCVQCAVRLLRLCVDHIIEYHAIEDRQRSSNSMNAIRVSVRRSWTAGYDAFVVIEFPYPIGKLQWNVPNAFPSGIKWGRGHWW